MANFEKAHKKTSSIEGGYVNDPTDKGKETYKGISRRFFPSWEGWIIIDEYKKTHQLKRNDVVKNDQLEYLVDIFYKNNFWNVNRLDEIENQDIANELFDTGVNMYWRTAAKMLQEALNLLNRDEKDYCDIAVDGKIGNITLSIVNNYKYPKALLKTLNGLQFKRYVSICKADPSQEKFFRGWLLRV